MTSDYAWAFWDVLPTFAEAAGIRPPGGLDGVSVLPALTGKPQKPHEYLYWEFHEGGFQQAVRQGNWKLVRQLPRMETELFNLESDLAEMSNIASQNPAVVERLQTLFREARTESTVWTTSGPRPQFQEK
jgi:arylsulfatase A-like enzyme